MKQMYQVWILLATALSLQAGEAPDFRQAKWGDSPEAVKAHETATLEREGEGFLAYSDTLTGLQVGVIYMFTSNKLSTAGCMVNQRHMNATDYISDYRSLKELLAKKYGQPVLDKVNWKNDMFKDRPDDWGTAVSMGQMEMATQWTNSNTTIRLNLKGDNMEVKLGIGYVPLSQIKALNEKREKEDLNKL